MKLSAWAHKVSGYLPKEAFIDIAATGIPTDADIDSFIRLYIFENIPNFIIDKSIAFDKVRRTIASVLEISETDINLTGSAKLGFSLNPKQWLKDYHPDTSDLDFFIISEKLYSALQQDISSWEKSFQGNDEKLLLEFVIKNSKRGFIDTWHIPNRYKNTNKCNYVMYRTCLNINIMFGRKVTTDKNASIRCYKDNNSALRQIRLNIRTAMKESMC